MASFPYHLGIHFKLGVSLQHFLLSAPGHDEGEVEELAEVELG